MRSRTSRTTTASPCLEAAARAAREARLRESAIARPVRSLLAGSMGSEILPYDDRHVCDARRLHTNVHLTHTEGSNYLIGFGDEALVARHHLRADGLERSGVLRRHHPVAQDGQARCDQRA